MKKIVFLLLAIMFTFAITSYSKGFETNSTTKQLTTELNTLVTSATLGSILQARGIDTEIGTITDAELIYATDNADVYSIYIAPDNGIATATEYIIVITPNTQVYTVGHCEGSCHYCNGAPAACPQSVQVMNSGEIRCAECNVGCGGEPLGMGCSFVTDYIGGGDLD